MAVVGLLTGPEKTSPVRVMLFVSRPLLIDSNCRYGINSNHGQRIHY